MLLKTRRQLSARLLFPTSKKVILQLKQADVVIQNDRHSKIVSAVKVGKITRNIVWQNITLAMVIKVIVLILGAGGIAALWEAVIADVGVALLDIVNAVRIQKMKV